MPPVYALSMTTSAPDCTASIGSRCGATGYAANAKPSFTPPTDPPTPHHHAPRHGHPPKHRQRPPDRHLLPQPHRPKTTKPGRAPPTNAPEPTNWYAISSTATATTPTPARVWKSPHRAIRWRGRFGRWGMHRKSVIRIMSRCRLGWARARHRSVPSPCGRGLG